MCKITNWLKKNELIVYTVLTLLLLLCCFEEYIIYAVIAMTLILVAFNRENENVKLLVFLYPFNYFLDATNFDKTYSLIMAAITLSLGIRYFILLIRKKKKLNILLFISMLAFIIYISLPIHQVSIIDVFKYVVVIALIYLIYETREKYLFEDIGKTFCFAMILSIAFGLLEPISERLQNILPNMYTGKEYNLFKYAALFENPNYLSANSIISIAILYILLYRDRIRFTEFLLYFAPIFMFTFLTVARLFMLMFILISVIFGIAILINKKRKAISILLTLSILCIIVFIIAGDYFNAYINRFSVSENLVLDSNLHLQDVYEGKINYDPGRLGLYKLYIDNTLSSLRNLLFGRGISAPLIGQRAAHSIVIQYLNTHGIIGCLLLIWITILMIKWKKVTKYKLINFLYMTIVFIGLYIVDASALLAESFIAIWLILVSKLEKKQDLIYEKRIQVKKKMNNMKNKTNILIWGMTDNPGGVENVVMNYYRNIDKSNLHFIFIALNKECNIAYSDEIIKNGDEILSITSRRKNLFKHNLDINNLFKNREIDIAWVNVNSLSNVTCLKFAKKYNVPTRIIHIHNTQIMSKNPFTKILHKHNKKTIAKIATDFFACSKDAGEFAFKNEILKSDKYLVLNNAIDTKKFRFNEIMRNKYRKNLGIDDGLVFGHVGRFHFQKNQVFLIKVFNEICKINKNVYLLLVGSGEDEGKIKGLVASYGLQEKVIFLGVRNDVDSLFQAMDCMIFPSVFEGLGLVLIEAQGTGLTCYTSDVVPDVTNINNNIFYLSLNEEPVVWAKAICENKLLTERDKQATSNIIKSGYDIFTQTKILQNIFNKKV